MTAPDKVLELIDTFERNLDHYKAGKYNETQLRIEFLDPFFTELGWDVNNKQGYAEAYKDVIHEDAIKMGETTKAPDYCFRIGGMRKFFVEAKKPSVSLDRDKDPALQLRSYAWTAKLPLSILTGFEEFAVYDCLTIRPHKNDKPSTARIRYYTFRDYADKWEDIYAIFGRESILKGSFDKYAVSHKKRGTAEVDDEFLKEIESWRESLARNLALRNPELVKGKHGTRDLNYAVQKTIDRIIFLRICEDRGIERPDQLRALQNGDKVYEQMGQMFERADERYNSGLFHFHQEAARPEPPDELTLNLSIDDQTLKEIIRHLYYPESPYRFSVFPADILGQVYEQFLGKVIRLTKGHQAKVDEKPEVKKTGGVYYTPTYIVDYIVQQTIGQLVEGKTPFEIAARTPKTWKPRKSAPPKSAPETDSLRGTGVRPLKVLDPACGSGSFLIGAYQYLLHWYRDWYTDNGPENHKDRIYESAGGEWKLTTAERKRILLDHIYGVDIDPQAVEVTKLSLLLKVLEGENEESINSQMRLFHERALPDLSRNIKCGNSLIGSDFYRDKQLDLFDEEERMRINAFDWEAEFAEIISTGGFDVVIGNPPYRRELDFKELMDEIATSTLGSMYQAARMDLWYYFAHRAMQLLARKGLFSFIVNAYWTAGKGAEKLIQHLQQDVSLRELLLLGKLKIFRDVSGRHMIFLAQKVKDDGVITIKKADDVNYSDGQEVFAGELKVFQYTKTFDQTFREHRIDTEPPSDELLAKIERHPPLSTVGIVKQGIAENPASINKKTNEKHGSIWNVGQGVFAVTEPELRALNLSEAEASIVHPYHDLCDLDRYHMSEHPSLNLIYSTRETCPNIDDFPNLQKHLSKFRPIMELRRETKKGANNWWHLHWPRDETLWTSSKILSIQMGKRPSFACAFGDCYVPFSVNVFVPNHEDETTLFYLSGILNSKLLWKWYQHHAKKRGVGLEINGNVLKRTPIAISDDMILDDRQRKVAMLAKQMHELNLKVSSTNTAHRKTLLERQIEATDREIDRLVYQLYGLSDDEIAIVEEATA